MFNQFFIRLVVLLMIIGGLQFAFAQSPDTLWTKIYGGDDYDYGNSVIQTDDGSFLIAGMTGLSFPGGLADGGDVWLLRTDSEGDTLWTKTFGGSETDEGYSIQSTSGGGYIIAGYTNSGLTTSSDAWLINIDENGEIIWEKTFGGTGVDVALSVKETTGGNFVFTGFTSSYSEGSNQAWLVLTDTNGDLLWMKTYDSDRGNSVEETSDGGFIVTGNIISTSFSTDLWLLQTDADGNTIWEKTYNGIYVEDSYDHGADVKQMADGGFIITGGTNQPPVNDIHSSDMWLVRTDTDGDTIWTRHYGGAGSQVGNSLFITPDGGFIVSGGNYLVHTDNNGDTIWTKTLTGNFLETPVLDDRSFIHQTSDGGYVVVGTIFSNTTTYRDILIVRFESIWDDVDVVHKFVNNRPAFNKFKGDLELYGDYNGDGFVDLAIIDECSFKVIDIVNQIPLFEEDYTVDTNDFATDKYLQHLTGSGRNYSSTSNDWLICSDGKLEEGNDINLIGFIKFGETLHIVVNAASVDGADFLIWQRGIIINTVTKEIVFNETGKFVAIFELLNGKNALVHNYYGDAGNQVRTQIIGEINLGSFNNISHNKIINSRSHNNQQNYELDIKFQAEPGLKLAYDPDLFDPPNDTDLDGDGYIDLPMLFSENDQTKGIIVRGGNNFNILWEYIFPEKYKDNIMKGFHGFADVDGNGVKEAIFGNNLAITLDGTVHTIADNFVTLDVNDVDNDGFEDIIGINTVDSSIVVYGIKTSTSADNNYKAEIHFKLFQNYPNPFNPSTTISYSVSQPGEVDLIIFNSLGQVVRKLVGETKPAGEYTLTWDGRNNTGQLVSSGAYFYRLIVGEFIQTRRMLLLK